MIFFATKTRRHEERKVKSKKKGPVRMTGPFDYVDVRRKLEFVFNRGGSPGDFVVWRDA